MAHEQAKKFGKAQTDGRCVFSGLAGVDGSHWFPAGDYRLLADVPENIFAMNRALHCEEGTPCFEWKQVEGVNIKRPVAERRWMLEHMIPEEMADYVPAIRRKISIVGLWCERVGYEFPEAEQPTDLYELKTRGATWKSSGQ